VGVPLCCQYVHPVGINSLSRSKADMATTLCGTNIGSVKGESTGAEYLSASTLR
jgi:hypothetical protein